MISKSKIGLSKRISDKLVKIILSYKKPEKILLFGSRATGYFTDKSDIDIALLGKKWDEEDLNEVKFRLNECLSTPLKIDVVNYYSVGNKRLKSRILNEGRLLYESEKIR